MAGVKGYAKGKLSLSCSTVSWNHQKNRGGIWKATAAFQLPDSLRIFSDSSVWGRKEETWKLNLLNLLCTDSLSASFPFISFPFSFMVPIGKSRVYVINLSWVCNNLHSECHR